MAILLQSVTVTADAPRGGIWFLVLITLGLLWAAWILRKRKRFWLVYACCASANLLALNLAPEHDLLERVLDPLYWPLEWPTQRFGFGVHDGGTMFLLFIALPFLYSLSLKVVVDLTHRFLHRNAKKSDARVRLAP